MPNDEKPWKRQLRLKRERGECYRCKNPAVLGDWLCVDHKVSERERLRKYLGNKKRLLGAKSYRIEYLAKQGHKI